MANTKIPSELVAINAISGTLIADNAITSVHIAENNITATQIAINAVTALQMADGTITSAKIADGTIVTADIADGQITTVKIADSSVTTAKIAAGTILGGDIANNAILTQHIDDNQITADQIADNAVGLGQLASLSRGSLIYGNSAGNPAYLAAGTNGHVLTSDGTDISWTADTDLFLATAGGTVTGDIIISETNPIFTLQDTDATATYNRTEFQNSGGSLNFNTRHSNGTFVSTDYQIGKNASGATEHKWTIGNTAQMVIKSTGDVKVGALAVSSATTAPLVVAKASTDVQAIFGDNNSSIDDPSIRIIGRNTANNAIRYTFLGLDADTNHGYLGYNAGAGGFVNALNFDTSGNVGIGIDSPSKLLHLQNNSDPTIMLTKQYSSTTGSIGSIIFGNGNWDSSMASIRGIQDGTNDGGKLEFKTQADASGGEVTRFTIFRTGLSTFNGPASSVNLGGGSTGSSALYVNSTSGHTGEMLQILKNGSTRMEMSNAGKLGVGISGGSISSKLHVRGTQSNTITTANAFAAFDGNGGDGVIIGARTSSPFEAYIQSGYTPNIGTSHHYPLVLNPNGGSVGIGALNPAKPLHLKVGSGWATMRLEGAGDSGGELEFYATSTKKGSIWFGNDGGFNVRVNGADDAIKISPTRQITQPAQTFFSVGRSGNQTFAQTTWVDIVWNSETTDTGGNFASNTFTAPVAGVYLFAGLIGLNTITATGYVLARFACNTAGDFYITHEVKRSGGGDYGYDSAISEMITLAAGETVKIQLFASGGGNHTLRADTRWQGRLMG